VVSLSNHKKILLQEPPFFIEIPRSFAKR